MIDNSIVERLFATIGSENVVSVGIGTNDTIFVYVNSKFNEIVPTFFEGYRVITQTLDSDIVPL
jgi:hypothetical protein